MKDQSDMYTLEQAVQMISARAQKMGSAEEVLKFLAIAEGNLADGKVPSYIEASDFALALATVKAEYAPKLSPVEPTPWLTPAQVNQIFEEELGVTFSSEQSQGTDIRFCADCGEGYEALAEEFRHGHRCDPRLL